MTSNVVSNIGDGGGLSASAVSTSISTALSTATSEVTSLSTAVGSGSASVPQGQIFGLQLAPDATSTVLDIAAGNCADSTAAALMTIGAFTKAIGSAWAVGTGNGSLDTGAVANNTWYHVFVIAKAGGASPDILTSLSATAPTLPSTYTLMRRIGAFKTNGSAQVTPFSQFGDEFRWAVQVSDLNTATTSTTATLQVLTVPTGVKVWANILVAINLSSSGNTTLVTSPDDTDTAPGSSGAGPWTVTPGAAAWNGPAAVWVRTNTSAQVRHRETLGSGFNNLTIMTIGWRDDRGRNQ